MSIKSEFKKLKKYYKLNDLELYVIPDCKYFQKNGISAGYLHGYNIIIMKSYLSNERNLQFLLHEICHALQEKENRLDIPRNHTRRKYALELEAEIFAIIEYRKLYGETKREWDLADYNTYYKCYLKLKENENPETMTEEEIYNFVKNLEGESKKHIIKRLDKKNKKSLLEFSLSKICL